MRRRFFLLGLMLPLVVIAARAAEGDGAIASLRARLAELGRLEMEREGPGGGSPPPADPARRETALQNELRRADRSLLLPALDACLRGSDEPEIIGAAGLYSLLVGRGETRADPAYRRILLEKLAADDFHSRAYTQALMGALYLYPSRETVMAYKAVADRTPERETRVTALRTAASLLGIWLDIYTNSTPEQVDASLARFEAWLASNVSRIRFDGDGRLRLGGGRGGGAHATELSSEDRARIKEDSACVLRLLDSILGDGNRGKEDAGISALLARCGPALLGRERAALVAERGRPAAEAGPEGGPPSPEADLFGTTDYPTSDAALLAAVYVVAGPGDAGVARRARDLLAGASRAEVRRVTKGEPASVRRKALALAGGE